jgi:hypothetical protein
MDLSTSKDQAGGHEEHTQCKAGPAKGMAALFDKLFPEDQHGDHADQHQDRIPDHAAKVVHGRAHFSLSFSSATFAAAQVLVYSTLKDPGDHTENTPFFALKSGMM